MNGFDEKTQMWHWPFPRSPVNSIEAEYAERMELITSNTKYWFRWLAQVISE